MAAEFINYDSNHQSILSHPLNSVRFHFPSEEHYNTEMMNFSCHQNKHQKKKFIQMHFACWSVDRMH
jgi:hypothetical protein